MYNFERIVIICSSGAAYAQTAAAAAARGATMNASAQQAFNPATYAAMLADPYQGAALTPYAAYVSFIYT